MQLLAGSARSMRARVHAQPMNALCPLHAYARTCAAHARSAHTPSSHMLSPLAGARQLHAPHPRPAAASSRPLPLPQHTPSPSPRPRSADVGCPSWMAHLTPPGRTRTRPPAASRPAPAQKHGQHPPPPLLTLDARSARGVRAKPTCLPR